MDKSKAGLGCSGFLFLSHEKKKTTKQQYAVINYNITLAGSIGST
jgi:hypothetical protein